MAYLFERTFVTNVILFRTQNFQGDIIEDLEDFFCTCFCARLLICFDIFLSLSLFLQLPSFLRSNITMSLKCHSDIIQCYSNNIVSSGPIDSTFTLEFYERKFRFKILIRKKARFSS